MKKIALILCVLLLVSYESEALDQGKKLLGIAVYREFNKDIFIGGIYRNNDSDDDSGRIVEQLDFVNRLEYRITADRLSKSDFVAMVWSWANFSNPAFANSQSENSISDLAAKMKSSLYRGDSLVIEFTDTSTTRVLLNNHILLETKGAELFDTVRDSWLGQHAPKRVFKEALLSGIDLNTVGRYSRLNADTKRVQQVGSWLVQQKKTALAVVKNIKPKPKAKKLIRKAALPAKLSEQKQQWIVQQQAENEKRLRQQRLAEQEKAAEMQWQQYIHAVVKPLYGTVRYPSYAYRRKQEGRVLIGVEFNAQGELVNTYIEKESGYKMLDKAALSAVDASSPWPTLPAELANHYSNPEGVYSVSVPFFFTVNSP